MERRSRSQTRKANLSIPAEPNPIPGQNGLPSNGRHASLGRLPTEISALSNNTAANTLANAGFASYHSHHHSNLHNRPGGDARTLSPDRRNNGSGSGGRDFPKTSPHAHKSGSYNQYTHPPPPPLTLPPSTSSSHVALGINGTTAHSGNNNNHVIGKSSYHLPAPPPRIPMSTSTPQNTPIKLDQRATASNIMNGGLSNGHPQDSSTTSSLSSANMNNSPKSHGMNKAPPIQQPTSPQVGTMFLSNLRHDVQNQEIRHGR